MLPKNRLGRSILKKLHIYATAEHPHESQNPQELIFNIKKVEGNV
jgi:large subunit ribosomal protein L13